MIINKNYILFIILILTALGLILRCAKKDKPISPNSDRIRAIKAEISGDLKNAVSSEQSSTDSSSSSFSHGYLLFLGGSSSSNSSSVASSSSSTSSSSSSGLAPTWNCDDQALPTNWVHNEDNFYDEGSGDYSVRLTADDDYLKTGPLSGEFKFDYDLTPSCPSLSLQWATSDSGPWSSVSGDYTSSDYITVNLDLATLDSGNPIYLLFMRADTGYAYLDDFTFTADISSSSSSSSPATNLLDGKDHGFESGSSDFSGSNWTRETTTNTEITSGQAQSGTYSARLGDLTSSYSGRRILSAEVVVSANTSYQFSGYFFVATQGAGVVSDVDIQCKIRWLDSGHSQISEDNSTGFNLSQDAIWEQKIFTETSPATAAYAQVVIAAQESTNENNDVYIDEVEIIQQ